MKTDITIEQIKAEVSKRIANFEKYRLSFEISQEIVYVKCPSAIVKKQYEVDVDMGGKSFRQIVDELVPKVTGLIKIYEEKSP